jgi:hypothetical protein
MNGGAVWCIQSVPEAEAESGKILIRVEMELKRRMAIGEESSALPHQSAQALPFPATFFPLLLLLLLLAAAYPNQNKIF